MTRWWPAAILLLAVATGSACGSDAAPSPTSSPSPSTTPTPTATPACADRVFATMTLDQRIGQLFELGLAGDRLGPTEISMIQMDHIGSVWFVATSSAGVARIRAVTAAVLEEVCSPAAAKLRFFMCVNHE